MTAGGNVYLFEYEAGGGNWPLSGRLAVEAKTYVTAYQKAMRAIVRRYRSSRGQYQIPSSVHIDHIGRYEVVA